MLWQERPKCRNMMLFYTPEITSVMLDCLQFFFFCFPFAVIFPVLVQSFIILSQCFLATAVAQLQMLWHSWACYRQTKYTFAWLMPALWLSTHSTDVCMPTVQSELVYEWGGTAVQSRKALCLLSIFFFLNWRCIKPWEHTVHLCILVVPVSHSQFTTNETCLKGVSLPLLPAVIAAVTLLQSCLRKGGGLVW